ncbi:MAG: hypothetical protein IKP65_07250 [Alphaproteobacteria bacterium]|nr:hypothetical protein [Alphaproteobacteria bacterium]
MSRKISFFAVALSFLGVFTPEEGFSREVRRSSKIQKASNYKGSSGLRVSGVPTESETLKCGQNAVPNATNTACECADPTNYVINTVNPTECYQKLDPTVIAQKKACGNVLLTAVNRICETSFSNNGLSEDGEIKCYDPNDLFLKFDTSGLIVYIDGVQYSYDKTCYIYTEDLMKSISDDYQITGLNSPNCKLKRVVAEASNECFQAVLSTGRGLGATKSIANDLQKICGYTGLHAKWAQLFGNDDSSKVNFPTDIPDLYLKTGKLSAADGMALVGNLIDGKMTDKSNTWEREITRILNSHLNDVGAACGKEYAISMHNVDISISDEKSSLENAVSQKGAIKGAQDWAMMQASVFVGEKKANEFIKKGAFGSNDDSDSLSVVPIIDVKLDSFKPDYDTFKNEGLFVLVDEDKFSIIKVSKNAVIDERDYESVKYDDSLDLPKDAYKRIIGKQEVNDLKGKIKK